MRITNSHQHRRIAQLIKRSFAVLALVLALAACQASDTEAQTANVPAIAPETAAGAPSAPAASPDAAAGGSTAVPVTTADAADDAQPAPLDDSYNKASLRPEYAKCIKATEGVTPEIQACQDEEFAWQEKRLQTAWGKIADGPDSVEKDKLADEQAAYMEDTDKNCTWNTDEDGQGQMLDAQSCRINRYANRADALQALTSK